jgi:putative alpha-1,2-mannosidase
VNTLRGSDSTRDFSYGNTFPAVALPFGFNFWTPITEGNSDRWLYNYRTPTIKGFAVSHEPSPWIGDHGSIQIMPMSGELRPFA